MNSETTRTCFCCGIPESEAKRVGIEVKLVSEFLGIPEPKQDVYKEYICSVCIKSDFSSFNEKQVEDSMQRTGAFMAYVDSSAFFFKVSVVDVTQACFNMFCYGVMKMSSVEKNLAISVIKSSIGVIEKMLEDIESGKDEETSDFMKEYKRLFRGSN